MKYIVLFDILAYHCARNAPKPRYEYHSGDPEFAFYFIIGFARNTSMDEDDVNVRYVDAAGSAAEPIRPSIPKSARGVVWQHIPLSVKTSAGHRGGRHAGGREPAGAHSGDATQECDFRRDEAQPRSFMLSRRIIKYRIL
ncbi:hypothetical protein ACJJTC_001736 [Scirpophaga incertulas]